MSQDKSSNQWKGYWKTRVSKVSEHEILVRGYSLEELIGNLSFTEAIFLTIRGELPTEKETQMMDALLCAILDHQFINSTAPAARYVASANPQVIPSIAAGVLAMGRNTVSPQDSAELIDRAWHLMQSQNLSREETAKRIVDEYMAQRRRLPGFGHPTHKLFDPRSRKLRLVAEKFGYLGERTLVYEAIHAEFLNRVKKDIPINVDGRMACIMCEMGFDSMEMACIGVLSYLPGIIAQVVEEIKEGVPLRIIPDVITEYIGLPRRPLPSERIKF